MAGILVVVVRRLPREGRYYTVPRHFFTGCHSRKRGYHGCTASADVVRRAAIPHNQQGGMGMGMGIFWAHLEGIVLHSCERLLELSPKIGFAILIVLGFWLAGMLVKRIILLPAARLREGEREVLELAGVAAKIGIVTVGAITALGTVGVNVTALVASLGLSGFALGFAARDMLSNLLGGMLILLYHPFRRGDRIAVAGSEGVVIQINLRYTVIDTGGKVVLIPNSILLNTQITVVASRPAEQALN